MFRFNLKQPFSFGFSNFVFGLSFCLLIWTVGASTANSCSLGRIPGSQMPVSSSLSASAPVWPKPFSLDGYEVAYFTPVMMKIEPAQSSLMALARLSRSNGNSYDAPLPAKWLVYDAFTWWLCFNSGAVYSDDGCFAAVLPVYVCINLYVLMPLLAFLTAVWLKLRHKIRAKAQRQLASFASE